MSEFVKFAKIPRLRRDITITEKIDGTNAQVHIEKADEYPSHFGFNAYAFVAADDALYRVRAGSRKRWIDPRDDNFGFADWVWEHAPELVRLGEGTHYGEWWGSGIQRGYGLRNGEKRFSLFNTARWASHSARPECCDVVPTIYAGPFTDEAVSGSLATLADMGSVAAPGFDRPEGIVVFHHAANGYFKVLLHNDDIPKGLAA